jgi:DUF971 family protein
MASRMPEPSDHGHSDAIKRASSHDASALDPRPEHLELDRERGLTIRWSDGLGHFLSIADLRRHSPSADARELRAAMAKNPLTVLPASKASGPLRADTVEPVGHYAIRIRFNDGHDTGIYTWRYLRELCGTVGKPVADASAQNPSSPPRA